MNSAISFTFCCLLMISTVVEAEPAWDAIDEVDPFTDEEIKGVVYEDDTHRIQISQETDNSIGMYLTLRRGTFEPNTKLELRVDKNPLEVSQPVDDRLNQLVVEGGGMPLYHWTPSTLVVMFTRTDFAKGEISCANLMIQFLNGKNLIGRYYVTATSQDTFSVSLEGFKAAANQVFEISDLLNNNPDCLR